MHQVAGLMTKAETAGALEKSVRTLDLWASRQPPHGPPRIKINRRVYYHPDDVASYQRSISQDIDRQRRATDIQTEHQVI